MKIISVANQKGGVGKTTTSVSLGACLAERGIPTLLIDLDSQANATSALGVEKQAGRSLYPVFLGQAQAAEFIIPTCVEGLDLLPAEPDMAGIEVEISRVENSLLLLRQALAPLKEKGAHKVVIIDCPPSLGTIMAQGLAAADSVIIPIQCEYLALEGLTGIMQFLDRIRAAGRPDLALEGIVMTMWDSRTRHSQSVVEEVKQHFGTQLFETVIPRTIRLAEAPSFGRPITLYDGASAAAQAYRHLTTELCRRCGWA